MVKLSKEKYLPPLLKAADLKNTITEVKIYRYDEKDLPMTGMSDVLYVTGFEMPLGLNKTNMKILVDLYGDETDAWQGRPIALTKVSETNPQTGKKVEVIRLAAVVKKDKQ